MFNFALESYVSNYVSEPKYSEIFTTVASFSGGNLIASRQFSNQKVRLILLHGIFISMPQANVNTYTFTDQFNNQILRINTGSFIQGTISLPYIMRGDIITIKTNATGGAADPLSFTIICQYVQELAGNIND